MTKLDSSKRIHEVRVRGGNTKYRALRLDSGNFAWGSESITRKTRLIQVVSRLSLVFVNVPEGVSEGNGDDLQVDG